MRISEDARRLAYCDVFEGTPGDVNVFLLRPSQPSGWHKHQFQTDQFFVAFGCVMVGTWRDGELPEYGILRKGESVTIPPGTWHGYKALGWGADLVMYLDRKYDPTDEYVTSFAEVPWSPPE